ncbi:MAG: hypothetical protein H0T42_18255 [Deltaproteobacteria bacterium]|nr:hypothetical protein [Deltaproteobacteria bacterium]
MMNTRLLVPALAALVSLSAVGCVITTDDDATFTIVNESSYVIEEIYLTDVGDPTWGSNQLRGDVLFPNETFTFGVNCDYYDALIIDEDGVRCEVFNLDLCLNDSTWYFRNNTCTVFNAAAKARAEAEAAKATTATTN